MVFKVIGLGYPETIASSSDTVVVVPPGLKTVTIFLITSIIVFRMGSTSSWLLGE
jgi:hypothetical protein